VRLGLAASFGLALVLAAVLLRPAGCNTLEPPPRPTPEIAPALAHEPGWNETRRYSVNRVLVVRGESFDLERALAIAKGIVEPAAEGYDEVLVYVSTPGDDPRTRRVQWTKDTGYRLLDY
jgi:hypothetical protein